MQLSNDTGIRRAEQTSAEPPEAKLWRGVVRPEGFEPPTLWFEAKCSIQLSYGRGKQGNTDTKNNGYSAPRQLRCRNRLRRWRRNKHRHRFDDVEARTAEKLMNHRLRQPAGVVLDPHRLLRFIEIYATDTINLAHLRHRQGGGFARRNTIVVKNIKLCHTYDDTSGK